MEMESSPRLMLFAAVAVALIFQNKPVIAESKMLANGDKIEFSYKPKKRLIWTSFKMTGDSEIGIKENSQHVLKMVADFSKEKGALRFAVTGVFCMKWRRVYIGDVQLVCKIQAAMLNEKEKVKPRPKDDIPVYFHTEQVISGNFERDWLRNFDINTGIRESIDFSFSE